MPESQPQDIRSQLWLGALICISYIYLQWDEGQHPCPRHLSVGTWRPCHPFPEVLGFPRFKFSQKYQQWKLSPWLLTLSMDSWVSGCALPRAVHPRRAVCAAPGWAALSGWSCCPCPCKGGWSKAGFCSRSGGQLAGSRADTPAPCLQMSPLGTGGWKPKHRVLQGGKKIKRIEMK